MFSVFDHGKITKNGGRCGGKSCWHGAFSCKHVAKRQLRTIFTPSFSPVGGPRARPCRRCRPMARRGVPRGRVRLCSAPAIDGPAGRLVFVTICAARHRRRGPRRKLLQKPGGCGRLPFGIAKQAVLHGETGRSGRPRGTFGSAIRRKWLRGRGVVNVFHSPRRIAPTPVRHRAEYGQSACRRAF